MTIKDIEQMRDVQGNVNFYAEEQEQEVTHYIYFKSIDSLLEYVKKNYNDNLTHKENSKKKITGVKIWRK